MTGLRSHRIYRDRIFAALVVRVAFSGLNDTGNIFAGGFRDRARCRHYGLISWQASYRKKLRQIFPNLQHLPPPPPPPPPPLNCHFIASFSSRYGRRPFIDHNTDRL